MSAESAALPTEDIVLVIAPPGTIVRATSVRGPCAPLIFDSLEALEAWCTRRVEPENQLRQCVDIALQQIGKNPETLSERMHATLEFIARGECVPILKQLLSVWPSRRSFFRRWAVEMPEAPSRFLQRIRVAHALRLGATTNDLAQAVKIAGFPSMKHFHAALDSFEVRA